MKLHVEFAPIRMHAIVQMFEYVQGCDKTGILMRHLKECDGRMLIFVDCKHIADYLEKALSYDGINATSIHEDHSQCELESALADFHTSRCPVLIATDCAVRGLDIPNVQRVINYDMPNEFDSYVHRICRTGRCGNTGTVISFVNDHSHIMGEVLELLKESNQKVPSWFEQMVYDNRSGGRVRSSSKERVLAAEARALRAETELATARAEYQQRLRLLKEEGDAALAAESIAISRDAQLRANAADERTSAIMSKLQSSEAMSLAAHESSKLAKERALIAEQDACALRSEFEKRLRLLKGECELIEQRRLVQCKTIGDLQHQLASARNESSRHMANVKNLSAHADGLREKLSRASSTVDALRDEITAIRLSAKKSTVPVLLPALSPCSIPISATPPFHASSSQSASFSESSSPTVSPASVQLTARSNIPTGPASIPALPNSSASPCIGTFVRRSPLPTSKSRLPHVNVTRELPSRAFPTSSPALVLTSDSSTSNRIAGTLSALPAPSPPVTSSSVPCPSASLPASLVAAPMPRRVAAVSVAVPLNAKGDAGAGCTSEQLLLSLQHFDQYHACRTVCLMAIIAMMSSPSMPGHILTVSMRGAVFEPVAVDVH
jgi:hypothetical protein